MRSQIKIIVDILDALEQSENGAKITDLVRKANVPYVRLTELLDELLKKNFVELVGEAGNYYKITKNGAMLLDEYRKFSSFAQNLGLDVD
ncbi:MAG: transcriptional regulator [Nitrososphaerota archaeon]|jgi:predicted transcriptional regulator|nr:winged helix-turn-helix domain-containing protein [Nitrososphaerota archaeon]MDG6927474.1 transcriptional regulator [Nitrososphaerota archaeon]MDG6930692.1 transcriptional regulator [Nitrososphaerota archaeon]MDG6931535.1 transcriptional regulator [Nitrososphaerota archaeon]MDG6936268.1 transcriptional regulator [Nitrososphaerota archaeon]